MTYVFTQNIPEDECMGDSLNLRINPNFLQLDTAVQTLSTNLQSLIERTPKAIVTFQDNAGAGQACTVLYSRNVSSIFKIAEPGLYQVQFPNSIIINGFSFGGARNSLNSGFIAYINNNYETPGVDTPVVGFSLLNFEFGTTNDNKVNVQALDSNNSPANIIQGTFTFF
jgi:hypothetical protein